MAFILSMKVFLISVAILFAAVGIKLSVPLVFQFLSTYLPLMWSFFCLWFKPPYIYVIINGIIITILASSRFHHHSAGVDYPKVAEPARERKVRAYEIKTQPEIHSESETAEPREDPPVLEVKTVVVNGTVTVEEDEDLKGIDDQSFKSTWTPIKRMDSSEFTSEYLPTEEKPLISARFGHRKPLKASPEGGRALKVSKPKRHETLESTWKMITEGRTMPLSRHMKKCDTWQNHGSMDPLETNPMKKSETFKDQPASTVPASSPLKLRKEPSLSQDELNRRVESFIRKFNEEMRLQRQESLKRDMEMVNRGSH
ncbi:hypothetical protein L6164_032771 [Bauhinia variegata]|uniref:Uncharacterized protein n=1 Tax=Bauhinia variegata TaxID=167791 RepID=A0ACB9KPQ0_BAUVA|nr:hypothetical protein L6164_032771 [Bauhinia variegata]